MLLMTALTSNFSAPSPVPIIRNIEVTGNIRIPAASILSHVSTNVNDPYNPVKLQWDLKNLYALGLFEDLQVQSRNAEHGLVDIVYHVQEYPFISGFSIEGAEGGLERLPVLEVS
jgi:outer membrane protein insertion porin family